MNTGLWNEEDKFFYDVLCVQGAEPTPLRIKSIVGLTSLFAISTIDKKELEKLTDFKKRINWFEQYRKKNNKFWPNEERSDGEEILLSLVKQDRLIHLLDRLLDEDEFLIARRHKGIIKISRKTSLLSVGRWATTYVLAYDPGDSTSDIFGGNSNWRGPVWIPINYLIIQSISRYGEFYGDSLKVECPKGSGNKMNLCEVADELTRRVISLFEKDKQGNRQFVWGL